MSKVYIYPLKTAEITSLLNKVTNEDCTLGEFIDFKSHEYLPKFVDYEANPIEAICLGALEKEVWIVDLHDQEAQSGFKMSERGYSNYLNYNAKRDVLCLVVSINNEIKSIPAHRCKTTPMHKS